jgi:hypothetical protein
MIRTIRYLNYKAIIKLMSCQHILSTYKTNQVGSSCWVPLGTFRSSQSGTVSLTAPFSTRACVHGLPVEFQNTTRCNAHNRMLHGICTANFHPHDALQRCTKQVFCTVPSSPPLFAPSANAFYHPFQKHQSPSSTSVMALKLLK